MSEYTIIDNDKDLQMVAQPQASPIQQSQTYLQSPVHQPTYLQQPNQTLQGMLQETFESLPQPIKDVGGLLARGLETGVGLTGDVLNLGLSGIKGLTNLGAKGESWLSQKTGIPENYLFGYNKLKSELPEEVPFVPTAESLHKRTKETTGQAFEPTSKLGEIGQDFVKDFVSFALPIPGITAGMKLGKAAGLSALGNTLSGIGKYAGFGPGIQGLMKAALYLSEPAMGIGKAAEQGISTLYDAADKAAGSDLIETSNLSKWFNNFTEKISEGKRDFPGIDKVKKIIKSLDATLKPVKSKILEASGKPYEIAQEVKVKDLWQIKKDINQHLAKLYNNKTGNSSAIRELEDINKQVNKALLEYGITNVKFGKAYNQAEELYRAVHDKSKFTETLNNVFNMKTLAIHPIASVLLHAHAVPLGPLAAGAAAGYTLKNVANAFEILKNSPTARSIVGKMFAAGTAENSKALLKYINELNDELERITGIPTPSKNEEYTIINKE